MSRKLVERGWGEEGGGLLYFLLFAFVVFRTAQCTMHMHNVPHVNFPVYHIIGFTIGSPGYPVILVQQLG